MSSSKIFKFLERKPPKSPKLGLPKPEKLEDLDKRLGRSCKVDESSSRAKASKTREDFKKASRVPYQYDPLPLDGSDVSLRLLILEPYKKETDPIECSISSVHFRDLPAYDTYEAVSYVWGAPYFTEHLFCNGATSCLNITSRLHDILVRLRKPQHREVDEKNGVPRTITLWIDAICIDQNNLRERGHQVRHMAKIYRRARLVHVFLSDRFATSSWLESNWFSRRWVVQELLSADEVRAHLPPSRKQNLTVDWNFLMQELENEPHKSSLAKIDPHIAETILNFRALKESGAKYFNMLSLLLKFQHARCSDDRDRIFAYIGIASDVWPDTETEPSTPKAVGSQGWRIPGAIKFTADYTISTPETYIRFAKSVMASSFPMDILHCAGAFRPKLSKGKDILYSLTELPSWVPDWRLPAQYRPLFRATGLKVGSWKTTNPEPVRIVGKTLRLIGVQVTKVLAILEAIPWQESACWVRVDDTPMWKPPSLYLKHDRIGVSLDNGMVGAAPWDTAPGDEVVLFPRARTLFLLRRMGEGTAYVLVGDCFVDGEAARGTLEETEFTIV